MAIQTHVAVDFKLSRQLNWYSSGRYLAKYVDLKLKLTDFGVSREDTQETMTVGVGTYRWMAPEILQSGWH